MLSPTPKEHLCHDQGRPYFLWDCDLSLADWQTKLKSDDADVVAYWLGAAMRQAKPDDVLTLVPREFIRQHYARLQGRLGRQEAFWAWLLARWQADSQKDVAS